MDIMESKVINGMILHENSRGLWVDSEGSSGYRGHFAGAWICYTDGAYCACNEGNEE